ncbi:MAG TPA: YwbE family protein [Brumimicrobium sp.]|nr:YwbE family protein [Brumimicrobium sp.]
MEGVERKNIKVGQNVKIVLKKDQRTGKLTDGIVEKILTSAPKHTHGIKVRLTTGEVGRVKEIVG